MENKQLPLFNVGDRVEIKELLGSGKKYSGREGVILEEPLELSNGKFSYMVKVGNKTVEFQEYELTDAGIKESNKWVYDDLAPSTELVDSRYLKSLEQGMGGDAIDISWSCTLDEYHGLAEALGKLPRVKEFTDGDGEPYSLYKIDGREVMVTRERNVVSVYGRQADLKALLNKYSKK